MNRYHPTAPRIASGLAAVALTVATLAVAVVAPAVTLDGHDAHPGVYASALPAARPAIEPVRNEAVAPRAALGADECAEGRLPS